jgi:hypothetical protein
MSGIVGSKFNIRGSGLVGSLGTDGQHMLSSGAGKSNVFETVAGGGGAWEYIARQTLGSDASDIQFIDGTAATDGTPDFGSDYAAVVFFMETFAPATDNSQPRMQISTDAGSSYVTSNYLSGSNYIQATAGAATNTPLYNNGCFKLGYVTDNDASSGLNGYVYIYNTSATVEPHATWQFTCRYDDVSGVTAYYGGAFNTTAQNVDAVKFYFNSGNVLAGTEIRMYGIKAS